MSITAGYWLLAAIGVLGELNPLAGGRRQRASVYLSICTSMAILLVWGFWPALGAQTAASVVAGLRSRLGLVATGRLVARTAAATGAAGVVESAAGFDTIRGLGAIDRSILIDLVLIIFAWLIVYHGPAIVAELRHERWRTVVRRGLGAEILTNASLLFLAPVVVAEPQGWTFALLALPLLALNRLSGLVNRQTTSLLHDQLTGLLNQRGLADAAADLGRQRRREPGRYALLLVRLNSLRDLDDVFGRRVVDAVLSRVAGRLVAAFGNAATVGRPDTDDLVVLVPRNGDPSDPMADPVGSAVATVNRVTAGRVFADGLPYDASATIGVVRSPEDAEDFPELLRHADAAIRFGRSGTDRVTAFTPRPAEEADRRLSLLTDLGAALRGEAGAGVVEFAYQPQVRLDTGSVVAVEALLRWTHPDRGAVSPDELFAIAEATPLIHDLTRLAIGTAVHQLRQWNDMGLRLRVSVNVTIRDLQQDWLVDQVLDQIERVGVNADDLVIEVTENEAISDPDLVRHSVHRLTTAGLQVAVDDFGSGFASLQHLRQLNLNQLKIDKTLIRSLAENLDDRAVVRTVIELARTLELTVVAEGVEDRAVHRILRQLGCTMGQGWLYGRPTTATEITRILSSQSHDLGRAHARRGGSRSGRMR